MQTEISPSQRKEVRHYYYQMIVCSEIGVRNRKKRNPFFPPLAAGLGQDLNWVVLKLKKEEEEKEEQNLVFAKASVLRKIIKSRAAERNHF